MNESLHWGWEVWLYFWIGGIAGGSFFTSALIELFGEPEDRKISKVGYYLSFGLAVLSGILLTIDLGQPLRFWHLFFNKNTSFPMLNSNSAISLGAWGLLGMGFFAFLAVLDMLVEEGRLPLAPFRNLYSRLPRKLYALLGGLFGFFVAGYTGVLLNTTAVPIWGDNTMFAALFVASAGATGLAAIALIAAVRNLELGTGWAKISRTMFLFLLFELILVALEASATDVVRSGNWALPFWAFVLFGLLTPLILQARASLGGAALPRNLLVLASTLVLAGGLVMRYLVVMSPQG